MHHFSEFKHLNQGLESQKAGMKQKQLGRWSKEKIQNQSKLLSDQTVLSGKTVADVVRFLLESSDKSISGGQLENRLLDFAREYREFGFSH